MFTKKNTYYTSRKILISYFVFLVVIPYILLSVAQVFFYINSIKREMVNPGKEIVELVNRSVEKQVYNIQNFMLTIASSNEYRDLLIKSSVEQYGFDLHESYKKMGELITYNTMYNLNIRGVVIVNEENKVLTYGESDYLDFEDVDNSFWFHETVEAGGRLCWFTRQETEEGTSRTSLIAARKIYDIQTLEEMGVLYVEVLNDFFDMSVGDGEQELMYLADAAGKPLLTLVQNDIAQDRELLMELNRKVMDEGRKENELCRVGNELYFPVISEQNAQGWYVVKIIPSNRIIANIAKSSILGGTVLLCCFAFFLAMFLVIYRRISRPLQYLIGLVNEIKADLETDIDLGKYPCYEAMQLSSEIINLSRENETIHNELEEISDVKTKIELDKLQAEINPHFIFNSLTALKYMALQNHQKEIGDMITALVKILRSTVNRDGRFITVAEELDNLKQYIHIQSVLTKDRIRFLVEVDPEVMGCYMPNFILQPLVENAVIHGLNPRGCEGTVSIVLRQQEGRMLIEITDDGVGVDLEKIRTDSPVHVKGKGLSNIALPGVIKKIELLYAGEGSFCIAPVETGGTRVTIVLPMRFDNWEMGSDDKGYTGG